MKAWQRPRKRGKRPSHTCWRKRNTRRDSRCDLLKAHAERAIFAPMANLRVTCICGAIYEVIETKGPSRETQPFKCVLCDSELISILFGTRACSLNLVTTLPVPATYVWKRKNEVEQIQTRGVEKCFFGSDWRPVGLHQREFRCFGCSREASGLGIRHGTTWP